MAFRSIPRPPSWLIDDVSVPMPDSADFLLAPGGEVAARIAEASVSSGWVVSRDRRWGQWLNFNSEGNGRGRSYDPFLFSLRKFRLFAGWLADGVSVDKDLNAWRSSINHQFARAELGRPARGFDVQKVIRNYHDFQLARKFAAGVEVEEFRVPTTQRCVERLTQLGMVTTGVRRKKCASLLWLALFGPRAATLGGYEAGDATLSRRHGARYCLRRVKKQPLLRMTPAVRFRSWPTDPAHPRARALRVVRRCLREDPHALGYCARCVKQLSDGRVLTDGRLEGAAAKLVTAWMRDLLGNEEVGIPTGSFIASHSWRIMLISACDAVPGISRETIRRETLHKTEASMLPYVRVFPNLRFFRLFYDDLST